MKAIALFALVGILAAVLTPGLGAGICDEAFVRCMYDPDLNQFMNFMGSIPLYCGLGYVFCKTYVDPIIV